MSHTYPQAVRSLSGLRHYWRLGGHGPWRDAVGGATATGSGSLTPVAGLVADDDGALGFANDGQLLATIPILAPPWSVACLYRDGRSDGLSSHIWVSTGPSVFIGPGGALNFYSPQISLANAPNPSWRTGTTHLLVATSDGTNHRFFASRTDGSITSNSAAAAQSLGPTFRIGYWNATTVEVIDEVAIYDRALTIQQVEALRAAIDVEPPPPPPPPAPSRAGERLTLTTAEGELDLNAGPIRVGPDGPDWGEAAVEQAMADAARGQLPVDQRLPNRPISIPLLLGADGPEHFKLARAHLQAAVARIQTDGGVLWRGGPGLPGLYADLVDAALKLPERWAHLEAEPDVILTLAALPDFYGEETERHTSASTGTDLVLTEHGILGDHPGRLRIEITDTEGQPKNGLLWAIRSSSYDRDAKPIYRAQELEPVAPAAVNGNVVRHASIAQSWTALLNWQTPQGKRPTHRGSYRVWARASATGAGVRCRLAWGLGDLSAPTINEPRLIPTAGSWFMLDLGEVRLDAAPIGHHHWLAQLQTRADTGTATVDVDKLYLQSLEGSGLLWVPPGRDPDAVLPADGKAELRTDGMFRQEQNLGADPPAYQPVSHVIGDLPRLFPGTNEILLRSSRGDLDTRPDPDLPDPAFTARIYYRPSYLNPVPPLLVSAPVITYPRHGQVIQEQIPLIQGTGQPGLAVELTIDGKPVYSQPEEEPS